MAEIKVSVVDFARFVNATTASARIGTVARAKNAYDPRYDFYKGIREAILRGHASGDLQGELRAAAGRAVDPRRQQAYRECGSEYLRFVGRKTVEWLARPKGWTWSEGRLEVRVNPEVVLAIRNQPHLLKIWFSATTLGLQGRRALLYLLGQGARQDQQPGLLNVRQGAVITQGAAQAQIDLFLGSEADAFVGVWRRLA